MLHDDKPVLDENLLEHFGVKGMRWGVRNKKTAGQIRTARRKVAKARLDYNDARDQYRQGTGTKTAVKNTRLAYLNHPDRATAARITKGDAFIAALLITPAGAAGLAVGSQIRSRAIEANQRTGHYNERVKKSSNSY